MDDRRRATTQKFREALFARICIPKMASWARQRINQGLTAVNRGAALALADLAGGPKNALPDRLNILIDHPAFVYIEWDGIE
ncbi:MAG: hypothetical protein ABW047_00065, partial [Nitrospiraceae bacterium]